MNRRVRKQKKRKKRQKRKQARQRPEKTIWEQFLEMDRLKLIRSQILASSRVDSCVRSTKILVQVGNLLGVKVEPLTVEANVFNPPFAKEIIKYNWDIPENVLETLEAKGCYQGVLGSRRDADRVPKPGKWPGHLVAIVHTPKHPVLVDLSLDQITRPQWDVLIEEPFVYPLTEPGFLAGTHDIAAEVNDLVYLYCSAPEDRSYEEAVDWITDFDVASKGRP